jgi:DNA-binding transcriptional LysR family regulator
MELRGDYHRVDISKGEADIAVRMSRPSEMDLVARKAFECGWFVYASQNYLAARGRPKSYGDLAQHRLVLYVEAMHDIPALRWMEQHRGAAREVSRLDNLEIVHQTIAADGGIAVLPCFIADPAGNLERVFSERVEVNTGWIIYHKSARDAARIRSVVEALVEFFAKDASVFSGVETSVSEAR